jgi:GAF domain-containing protein/anti-sigma regulatory factor (Ser/Thr protein kinase)
LKELIVMLSRGAEYGVEQDPSRIVRELEKELTEARQQQAAGSEILRVISNSPGNVQPVFETIARNAVGLCEAVYAMVFRFDGTLMHLNAHHNVTADGLDALKRQWPMRLDPRSVPARAVLERRVVHVHDVLIEADNPYLTTSRALGIRTMLIVPMLREGRPIGAVAVYRQEVRPFTDAQIELVKSFADQAVIAVENARLLSELRESLDYQIATADVLSAISRSPTDVQPVFDAIVASAARLCDAAFSAVARFDGGLLHLVAVNKMSAEETAAYQSIFPRPPDRNYVIGRAFVQSRPVHVEDVEADPDYDPRTLAVLKAAAPYRTYLGVPIVHDGVPIGVIGCGRREVKPFTEAQIALVKTFADQAVIAIENTRLFEEVRTRTRELSEALEYQTATSEMLGVISRSTFDLQPVLEAVVESATKLCGATRGHIFRFDGVLLRLAAAHGAWPGFTEYLEGRPVRPGEGTTAGRAAAERRTVHVTDVLQDPDYEYGDLLKQQGYRTVLAVPLLREGALLGVITILKTHVEPFTDKQIELVETFADQAVIAIENVRLFEEVQARNRDLIALGEIGRSVSSMLDLKAVLKTIVARAADLSGTDLGLIFRYNADDASLRLEEAWGLAEGVVERIRQMRIPAEATGSGDAIRHRRPIQFADVDIKPGSPLRDIALETGLRAVLVLPLFGTKGPIGTLVLQRNRPGEFSNTVVSLMERFADQSAIALENARLFEEAQARSRELSETLRYQTASNELLSVISRSKFDLQPVLETLVRTAAELCEADVGLIRRRDGDAYPVVATFGLSQEQIDHLRAYNPGPDRGSLFGRTILEGRTIHISNVPADPDFNQATRFLGVRAGIGVPLLREGDVVGILMLIRTSPRPFSDRQIELSTTFADQAGIAIENVRLFEEVQERTRQLARTVSELEALGAVSQAVSSSLEVKVVLQRILEHACTMSDAGGGAIYAFDKLQGWFTLEAGHNMSPQLIEAVRQHPIHLGESVVGGCAARREAVQIPDLVQATPHPLYETHIRAGVRSLLAVPLILQGEVLGALAVRRMRPGAFAPETVSLLQAFANQSAIALRNARLFREIEEKSRELEQASRHKSQFVANMSHELRTPLAAILGYAELMQEGFYGALPEKSTDALTRIRANGKHLLGLINTVLDIAKIESGQFSLNLSEYALETVVETVRAATESLAQNKRLAFKTDVARPMPVGMGDEQRLTQVLLNLVGNAIKFTDAGEVHVAAKTINGHFAVSVADTGPGIPERERTRIFEQFHQVDDSNTKAKGGTGLGLAIAKQIVEMHGGRIWVESTLGQGSTFRMELPVRAESRESVR